MRKPFLNQENEVAEEWLTVPEQEAKLYKTSAVLLDFSSNTTVNRNFELQGTLPIYSGTRLVGCVSNLHLESNRLVGDVMIDFSSPERLDLENGVDLWLEATFLDSLLSFIHKVSIVRKPVINIIDGTPLPAIGK